MGLKNIVNFMKMAKKGQKWPFLALFPQNVEKIIKIPKMRKNAHIGVIRTWLGQPTGIVLVGKPCGLPRTNVFTILKTTQITRVPPRRFHHNMVIFASSDRIFFGNSIFYPEKHEILTGEWVLSFQFTVAAITSEFQQIKLSKESIFFA